MTAPVEPKHLYAVRLTQPHADTARRLGGGNLSAGVRQALEHARKSVQQLQNTWQK
jgi:hypothetical protein